ncbi:hypothetical protein EPO34_01805 [Patescibacteria group bacterium]|nr:MAG: hypothetical protein EPO34_01805 [Patescibacteria group bacterium]
MSKSILFLFAFLTLTGCDGRTVVENTQKVRECYCGENEIVCDVDPCDREIVEVIRTACLDGSVVDDPRDCPAAGEGEGEGEGDTGLFVTLSSSTPASQTVPPGAASVEFIKVRLAETDALLPINDLTFRVGGVGAVSNIDSATLYLADSFDDPVIDLRVSDPQPIDPVTREVSFRGGFGLDPGETRTYAVRLDIAAAVNSGDTARLELVSIASDGQDVFGAFPISGNAMTFTDHPVGTVRFGRFPSFSPVVGETDAVVAQFTIQAMSEGANLKALTLNWPQALDNGNSSIWNDDVRLGDCFAFSRSLVFCDLDDQLHLDQDEMRSFQLRTDLFVEAGEVMQVAVEDPTDVFAFGDEFGFQMAVDISGYDDADSACTGPGRDCSYSVVSPGCAFQVHDEGGTLFQTQALPSFFPTSGGEATREVVPGPNSALTFEAFAQNACDGNVTLFWISDFSIRATDEDGTGWVEDLHDNAPDMIRLVNLTTGTQTPGTTVTFGPTVHQGTTTQFGFGFEFDPAEFIESGVFYAYELIVDTTGASVGSNDSIEVSTMFLAYWSDGNVSLMTSNLGPQIGTVLIH